MLLSLLLFAATMALSLWAMWRVKSVYNKHNRVPAASGISGAQAAAEILDRAGIHNVMIVESDEMLGDHYDPINRRLVLSSANYHGSTPAALGVAAHECGHAIQHKTAFAPLQWRMAAVGATNFASQLVTWLPLLFMFTNMVSTTTGALLMACGWGVIMLFNLVTLPVEFDASRRAKAILNGMGFIQPGREEAAVRSVLDAAAWTYVAAFITSFAYMLWHLLPLIMGRREE